MEKVIVSETELLGVETTITIIHQPENSAPHSSFFLALQLYQSSVPPLCAGAERHYDMALFVKFGQEQN
eukprot:scaffold1767_cov178-Ochromonas_danica.AAC.15